MDPARLRSLVDPAHTVVLTMELQKGVVGDEAVLPALPIAVRESGMLRVAGTVCAAARATGIRVVHATVRMRPDGAGQVTNCKIFALAAKQRAQLGYSPTDDGHPGVELADELGVQPTDIEVARSHGMTPFTSTSLDQIIRNLGARTIVLMGVSVNLGIFGAATSALDLGYQVVVVRDGVVGIPKEYADAVLDNSISLIATVVGSDELLTAWTEG